MMKTPIPTRRRMTPVLWMSNPEVFAETANLMIAPTTTSTMPSDIRPMPELLFMALSVGGTGNWFKDPGATDEGTELHSLCLEELRE